MRSRRWSGSLLVPTAVGAFAALGGTVASLSTESGGELHFEPVNYALIGAWGS